MDYYKTRDYWDQQQDRLGTYGVFTLYGKDSVDAIYSDPKIKRIKLNSETDNFSQVVALGLGIDGEGREYGDWVASRVRILTVSQADNPNEVVRTYRKGAIYFGHVVPRADAFMGDNRRPRSDAPLDSTWVCQSRSNVNYHLMKHDTVVGVPFPEGKKKFDKIRKFAGDTLYQNGKASDRWIQEAIPVLTGRRYHPQLVY